MFCKLVEHVPGRPLRNAQCRICDGSSTNPKGKWCTFCSWKVMPETFYRKTLTPCLSSLLFTSTVIAVQKRKKSSKGSTNACFSFLLTERHPISNAIDGTNNWWQSPSIQNGREYHWVTITLDLRQVSKNGCGLLNWLLLIF